MQKGSKENSVHGRSNRSLVAVKDACRQVSILHTERQIRGKAWAIPQPAFVPHSPLLTVLNNLRSGRGDQRGRFGKGQVCLIEIKGFQLSSDF